MPRMTQQTDEGRTALMEDVRFLGVHLHLGHGFRENAQLLRSDVTVDLICLVIDALFILLYVEIMLG